MVLNNWPLLQDDSEWLAAAFGDYFYAPRDPETGELVDNGWELPENPERM